MAGSNVSTLPLITQSSNKTSFKQWQDCILLREFQSVRPQPFNEAQISDLRNAFDMAPADYMCLRRLALGLSCEAHHPCEESEFLIERSMARRDGERCAITTCGKCIYAAATVIVDALADPNR